MKKLSIIGLILCLAAVAAVVLAQSSSVDDYAALNEELGMLRQTAQSDRSMERRIKLLREMETLLVKFMAKHPGTAEHKDAMAERRIRQLRHFLYVERESRATAQDQNLAVVAPPEEFTPPVDVFEEHDQLVIRVELPGIARENIRVAVSHNTVVVEGVKKNTKAGHHVSYHCFERDFGRFRRVIDLPRSTNTLHAHAQYELGVLTITVPVISDRRGQWTVLDVR